MDTDHCCGYTLNQLFADDITVVIPDIQRDYCWGSDAPSEKVSGFVKALIDMFAEGRPAQIGIIYGYSDSETPGCIYVIDGQQRLTTLYLLVGMLYRRTRRPDLRRMLMSDYELTDDREPQMIYQVRDEALYFMSDLVSEFFINRNGRLSGIKSAAWYHNVYESDPSVQSFICAIRSIDAVLEDASASVAFDFDAFAGYVAGQVTMAYFDLGSRAAAEDMFILLNTAGDPPSDVHSAKIRCARTAADYDLWDEMEQWFWFNRSRAHHYTSDPGMSRLLALAAELNSDTTASDIYRVFRAFSRIWDLEPTLRDLPDRIMSGASSVANALNALRFVVLPVLTFALRFTEASGQELHRIYRYFYSIVVFRRYLPGKTAIADALNAVRRMPSADLLSLQTIRYLSDKVMSQEERIRMQTIDRNPSLRSTLEEIFCRGEEHPMLMGRMQQPIAWSTARDGSVDAGRLRAYVDAFYDIWGTDIDCNPALDTVRRALLTMKHNGYPVRGLGDSGVGLCWRDYHWQRLMLQSPGLIRGFIDRVTHSSVFRLIDRFKDTAYPYYNLIKFPDEILKYPERAIYKGCLKIDE